MDAMLLKFSTDTGIITLPGQIVICGRLEIIVS